MKKPLAIEYDYSQLDGSWWIRGFFAIETIHHYGEVEPLTYYSEPLAVLMPKTWRIAYEDDFSDV